MRWLTPFETSATPGKGILLHERIRAVRPIAVRIEENSRTRTMSDPKDDIPSRPGLDMRIKAAATKLPEDLGNGMSPVSITASQLPAKNMMFEKGYVSSEALLQ